MLRTLAVGTGLALVLAAGVVSAGTPFGGDDTGTISSTPAVNKCENGVGKGVGKLVAAISKCHASVVAGKATDDEACEAAALTKFGATKTVGCAPCTNLATTGATVQALVDSSNNKVYCAAGTAFGADDTGNMPADAPSGPISKCENGVGKAVGKLVAAINKCHASRASGKLADDTAEDTCETTALMKFGATKTAGCDPCTNLATLGAFIESTVDGANNLVYCGSPSGAFLH